MRKRELWVSKVQRHEKNHQMLWPGGVDDDINAGALYQKLRRKNRAWETPKNSLLKLLSWRRTFY